MNSRGEVVGEVVAASVTVEIRLPRPSRSVASIQSRWSEPGRTATRLFVCLGRSFGRSQAPRPPTRESRGPVLTVDIALPEVEELQKLVQHGQEKGLPHVRRDRRRPRGGRSDEGADRGLLHLPDRPFDRARRGRAVQVAAARAAGARRGREVGAEARPHRRALARLAPPLPARDRQGAAADRRPGDLPGEADRARRHGREDADDRGEPAPRRLDREGLPRPRPLLPRPDPGGLARA